MITCDIWNFQSMSPRTEKNSAIEDGEGSASQSN